MKLSLGIEPGSLCGISAPQTIILEASIKDNEILQNLYYSSVDDDDDDDDDDDK